jgi:energy-converting hydrogenase Eha subunit C
MLGGIGSPAQAGPVSVAAMLHRALVQGGVVVVVVAAGSEAVGPVVVVVEIGVTVVVVVVRWIVVVVGEFRHEQAGEIGRQRGRVVGALALFAVIDAARMVAADPLAPPVYVEVPAPLVPGKIRVVDEPHVSLETEGSKCLGETAHPARDAACLHIGIAALEGQVVSHAFLPDGGIAARSRSVRRIASRMPT